MQHEGIRRALLGYAAALGAVGVAALSRLALQPFLGNDLPFALFFLAISGVAWRFGSGPAVVAIVAGFGTACWLFVEPEGSGLSLADAVSLAVFALVGSLIALLAERARGAQKQLVARQRELQAREALGRASTTMHELLHSALDPDEVLRRVVTDAAKALGADSAAISRREPGAWVVSHAHGLSDDVVGTRMSDDQERHAVLAEQTRRPVAIDDAATDPRVDGGHLARWGIRSVLVMPLVAGDGVSGAAFFNWQRTAVTFRDYHLEFATRVGSAVALALENANLKRDLERRVAERTAQVEQLADHLRALATELANVELRERRRLALVLHDHVQQLLVGARMKLELVRRRLQEPEAPALCLDLDATLREAIDASRSLAVELSPPVLHESGLGSALEWLAARMFDRHGLRVHVSCTPGVDPGTQQARTLLFDCTRELLFNTLKHSGVTEASVTLDRTVDRVRVTVRDAGRGFDPAALERREGDASFGIFSIQQRLAYLGGVFRVDTAAGRGTTVTLELPVGDRRPTPAAVPMVPARAG